MSAPAATRAPRLAPSVAVSAGIFVCLFAVYLANLAPGLTWENNGADGGDLATAVETWGVPHPPGYPTYVLVGRVFRLLPGETAYNLNVLSAVAGAGAVSLTFLATLAAVRLLATPDAAADGGPEPRGEYVPAAVGALCLGLAPLFWSQAVITEVYTLNTLLAAAIAWLVMTHLLERRTAPSAPPLRLISASLLFGLGMGNHFTVAAIAMPLIALGLWRDRRPVTWLVAIGATLAGLAVFAYLPLAAQRHPPVNWGAASTWEGFLWMATAKPYTGYLFGVPSTYWTTRFASWSSLMLLQFNGLGTVLALAGLWWMWRRDSLLTVCLLAGFFGVSVYAALYTSLDSLVFLLPALLVFALWLGLGTRAILADVVLPRIQNGAWRTMLALAVVTLLLVPGIALVRTYPSGHGLTLNLRDDQEARDYGRTALKAAEPGALVFAHADRPIFTLMYQRYALEPGSDVTVISRELLQFQWYRDHLAARDPALAVPPQLPERQFHLAMAAMVDSQLEKRPVYSTLEDPFLEGYVLEKQGPLWRVTGKRG